MSIIFRNNSHRFHHLDAHCDALGILDSSLDDAVRILHSHDILAITTEPPAYQHDDAGSGSHSVFTGPKTCQRLHSRSISDAHSLCTLANPSLNLAKPSRTGSAAEQRDQARRLRVRPLMALVARDNLTNFEPEPESPPDLTSSKSSKSSSFRSSSSLGEAAPAHDPSHFEDITLDDIHNAVSHDIYGADVPVGELNGHNSDKENYGSRHGSLPLPRTRSSVSSVSSGRSSGQSSATTTGPIRDLTNTHRPGYPSLKRQVNGAITANPRGTQSALHLPGPKSPRRGFTSPTNPHFSAPPFPPPSQRSRSPSPTFLQSFGLGQRPSRRSSSRSSIGSTTTLAPITRRASWQPGRKSVKELEDEYHDSDEDIPEDAIVWNVPLSPRPPLSRPTSITPEIDAAVPPTPLTVPLPRAATFSEPDSQPQSGSLHSLRRQRSTPAILEDPELTGLKPRPSPRSSRRPSPLQSVTDLAKVSDIEVYTKARTKSYSEAMSDLSNEARHITAALEAFELKRASSADTVSTSDANASSFSANTKVASTTVTPINTNLPSAPSPATTTSASGKRTVTLPPLRKGDTMIDPLPISKEKEKVLTRTRPSWLPPKDQREEKKHLKEYKRMMEASLEAEKKRVARVAAEQEARDVAAASLLKIWDSYVLPAWDTALAESRTRELWWRGVPTEHRGEVWMRAMSNELHLTKTSYSAALKRANEEEVRLDALRKQLGDGENLKEEDGERWAWFERLRADVDTLALEDEWSAFASPNPHHEQFQDVLKAYAFYRSDVGYVSGLHRLAALLLLNLPPANAFIVMANFLNRPLPMAYLLTTLRFRSCDAEPDGAAVPSAMSNTHSLVLKTLAYKLPSLHAHLTSPALALQAHEYLDPILSTFFTDPRIGQEKMSRTWDVMVFEGDKVLVRAAVAVLSRLENRLYGSRDEILSILGWDSAVNWSSDLGDADEWVAAMREAGKVDKRDD